MKQTLGTAHAVVETSVQKRQWLFGATLIALSFTSSGKLWRWTLHWKVTSDLPSLLTKIIVFKEIHLLWQKGGGVEGTVLIIVCVAHTFKMFLTVVFSGYILCTDVILGMLVYFMMEKETVLRHALMVCMCVERKDWGKTSASACHINNFCLFTKCFECVLISLCYLSVIGLCLKTSLALRLTTVSSFRTPIWMWPVFCLDHLCIWTPMTSTVWCATMVVGIIFCLRGPGPRNSGNDVWRVWS